MAAYEPLADTVAIASFVRVKPATVRSWARRGKLDRRGHDAKGRTLYSVEQAQALVSMGEQAA